VVEDHEDHGKDKHRRRNVSHRRHCYLALALSTSCEELLRSRTTTNRDVLLLHGRSLTIFFHSNCSRPSQDVER
jgi:hypothetical protein